MRITCPNCEFSREVPKEKIPLKARIATCPKCGHKFHFLEEPASVPFTKAQDQQREETQPEKKTGDIWSALESLDTDSLEDNQSEVLASQPGSTETEEGEIPWENLNKYGFFPGLIKTIKAVMITPIIFFGKMPLGQGYIMPLIFYLFIAETQALSQFFWRMVGIVPQMQNQTESFLGVSMVGMGSLFILVLYPILLTIMLFAVSGINHLCLKVVKAAYRNFEGTFKVVSYSGAPVILGVVPVIGPIIGMFWSIVCTFIGFKYLHKTTASKVILAMLLPLIVFFIISSVAMSLKGM